MNVVLDDAEEVSVKTKEHKAIGRIMLKGDNITCVPCLALPLSPCRTYACLCPMPHLAASGQL
jgi:hypothetical protein